jgi:putative DNA primase/helicase
MLASRKKGPTGREPGGARRSDEKDSAPILGRHANRVQGYVHGPDEECQTFNVGAKRLTLQPPPGADWWPVAAVFLEDPKPEPEPEFKMYSGADFVMRATEEIEVAFDYGNETPRSPRDGWSWKRTLWRRSDVPRDDDDFINEPLWTDAELAENEAEDAFYSALIEHREEQQAAEELRISQLDVEAAAAFIEDSAHLAMADDTKFPSRRNVEAAMKVLGDRCGDSLRFMADWLVGDIHIVSEHDADGIDHLSAAQFNERHRLAMEKDEDNIRNFNAEKAKREKEKAKASGGGLNIVCMDDVEAKEIAWLWPQRIALGKLALLVGNPDDNKSTLTLWIAAMISTGGKLPCNEGILPLGDVLILSAEDDAADTIKPRLEAAGADCRRVHLIKSVNPSQGKAERSFNLATDIGRLEQAIQGNRNIKAVLVDPVSAYMGKVGKIDTYRDSDVRGTLMPLTDMAAKYGVAIIGIAHLNKSSDTRVLMRVLASIAFTATARSTYLLIRDPDDDDCRLFLKGKNNLGNIKTGLACRIVERRAITISTKHPVIEWKNEVVKMTADEVLARRKDGRGSEQLEAAKRMLTKLLADGPVLASEIKERCRDEMIGDKSIRNAFTALKIVVTRDGHRDGNGDKSRWALPPM